MARNRIIHNVQDVLVGSPSGESNWTVTAVNNYEVLKRVEKVQSFSYDIALEQDTSNVLGKSSSVYQDVVKPPKVSLQFDYYLNGVVNEKRIGLNVANESSSSTDNEKNALYYMVMDSGRLQDKRNIYLITNNTKKDIRTHELDDYPMGFAKRYLPAVKTDVSDENAVNYGVAIFQNCYLNSYSLNASIGSIPKVTLGYQADNIIAESSADEKYIPQFNAKTAQVEYSSKKFIVPAHPKSGIDVNQSDRMGVEISKSSSDGLSLHNEHVQDCTVSFELDREVISYFGHKAHVDHYPKFPIKGQLSLSYINYNTSTAGNLFDNVDTNHLYNLVLSFKDKTGRITNAVTVSGAKLNSYDEESTVNENVKSSLSLSCDMDFENNTKGIFISGVAGEALMSELQHPSQGFPNYDRLTDNDGNILVSPQAYFEF